MATPFITFLGPTRLDAYKRGLPRNEQPDQLPGTFLDAMDVRTLVFVDEQKVSPQHEFDADDSRSCHWVVYASVNKVEAPAELADDGLTIITPRRSSTKTVPIGTVRAVPFPHPPHPRDGVKYAGGLLISETKADEREHGDEQQRTAAGKPAFERDAPTEHHDGFEPYIKLGRLAVDKEFRGHKIATLLVMTAFDWLKGHPGHFDPSVAELGLENVGAGQDGRVPKWNGLVCVHSQIAAIPFWERFGFKQDGAMGRWFEDGIEHVGMFTRLEIGRKLALLNEKPVVTTKVTPIA